MGIIELIIIGIGLAMDAFTVSLGKGLSLRRVSPKHALIAGVWFGGFQALMPIIGYWLGHSFSAAVSDIDHWIAFLLLLVIGVNMIREAWADDAEQDDDLRPRKMFVLAVATSIDALAVGVSMAFLGVNIWMAATIIGVITLLLSFTGVYLGSCVGSRLGPRAGFAGGVILIIIGIKIVVEHLIDGI